MGIEESPGGDSRNSKDRYSGLARLLRGRREELGLSRRDVVTRTKLSYPYVSQLEGGYRAPSLGSARKLADALHLPVEEVVRAAGGDLTGSPEPSTPARRAAPAGHFRNPAYSDGIMQDGAAAPSDLAAATAQPGDTTGDVETAALRRAAPHAPADRDPLSLLGGAGHVPGAAFAAAAAAPRRRTGPGELEAVADDVATLLHRLPPQSRLDALALVQSRLMAEMVQEQVRRATEG
ncbi:helix-turn-helix protein [Georgenia soli]|uniref:Helix-turn-helix protein n=1 Tax=Georgenia soli TaxID=638953 RepID=A0A2A9EKU3_9MICO|nr:helix-turn-helix transcriptional regulator [Georgenia soli]PFG39574.1 helix-turn-helix protein [Georgenia soli]